MDDKEDSHVEHGIKCPIFAVTSHPSLTGESPTDTARGKTPEAKALPALDKHLCPDSSRSSGQTMLTAGA